MNTPGRQSEHDFIAKLSMLKYCVRTDNRDRAGLEKNFHEKFEAQNRVRLTRAEFKRLHDESVPQEVFTAAMNLRSINAFTRDDHQSMTFHFSET